MLKCFKMWNDLSYLNHNWWLLLRNWSLQGPVMYIRRGKSNFFVYFKITDFNFWFWQMVNLYLFIGGLSRLIKWWTCYMYIQFESFDFFCFASRVWWIHSCMISLIRLNPITCGPMENGKQMTHTGRVQNFSPGFLMKGIWSQHFVLCSFREFVWIYSRPQRLQFLFAGESLCRRSSCSRLCLN